MCIVHPSRDLVEKSHDTRCVGVIWPSKDAAPRINVDQPPQFCPAPPHPPPHRNLLQGYVAPQNGWKNGTLLAEMQTFPHRVCVCVYVYVCVCVRQALLPFHPGTAVYVLFTASSLVYKCLRLVSPLPSLSPCHLPSLGGPS